MQQTLKMLKKVKRYYGTRKAMNKGFSYTVETEKIVEYMKLSVEDKLKWLEEILVFSQMVLNDKEKKFREKLRAGQI